MESKCANFLNANNIHLYFQCNQSKTEKIKSKLYADVHNFWSEIQAIEQPNSAVIKNQVIWENRYITIQNKPFRWQKWLQHGIRHVRDILSDEGDFLSHEEINQRYGLQCNFLNVLQIRHSHLNRDKSFVKIHQIVQYLNILFLGMIPYRPYVCVTLKHIC